MKLHPIISKQFGLWWFILASCVAIKFIVFGFKEGGLSEMEAYQQHGILFWVIGTLFTGLVFAFPFYLIYRLFSKKWNNKIFMIITSFSVGLLAIFMF